MPTLQELQARNAEKLRRAAVSFANDYGPLPAANRGEKNARHEVAMRLVEELQKQGLRITAESI